MPGSCEAYLTPISCLYKIQTPAVIVTHHTNFGLYTESPCILRPQHARVLCHSEMFRQKSSLLSAIFEFFFNVEAGKFEISARILDPQESATFQIFQIPLLGTLNQGRV
jgi:hypothetical protein